MLYWENNKQQDIYLVFDEDPVMDASRAHLAAASQLNLKMNSPVGGGPVSADTRAKVKEVLMRHHDLEQNKDKAQGTLVSILFMTQITELKMLLDIGRLGHRFYYFVLALLIASISLLIFVGMLIMYIGNLRYNRERKKAGFKARLKACLLCKCRIRCCCRPRRKRASSYICVPIGVGAPDGQMSVDQSTVADEDFSEDEGCCYFPSLRNKHLVSGNVERLDGQIESARVRVANAVVKIVRATNRVEEIEGDLKRHPDDEDLEDELARARAELHDAKREKEEAESDQTLCESHRQQAVMAHEQWEDREERTVFKTVTFWQHLTTYLLYFICLMNIFITAFGIYGGQSPADDVMYYDEEVDFGG